MLSQANFPRRHQSNSPTTIHVAQPPSAVDFNTKMLSTIHPLHQKICDPLPENLRESSQSWGGIRYCEERRPDPISVTRSTASELDPRRMNVDGGFGVGVDAREWKHLPFHKQYSGKGQSTESVYLACGTHQMR